MTLDPVKTFGEGCSLDTTFCTRLKKWLLKMEQVFAMLKAIPFLSFKQTLNTDAALDGQVHRF